VSEAVATAETVYRLGKKTNLWMTFEPTGSELNPTWTLQLTARNRGGSKILAVLWESTALKPIGSVTIKGETYPLTIAWHHLKRGGTLCLGGERKTGVEGGTIAWEMQIKPVEAGRQCFEVEMRLRSTPRREGRVAVHLNTPLYKPEVISLPHAEARGHSAVSAWSNYHKHAAGFVMLSAANDGAGWEEGAGGYKIAYSSFPFGGGKAIRFVLYFAAAESVADARQLLSDEYAEAAAADLHPVPILRTLDPSAMIARYADASAFQTVGIERLYPKPPVPAGPDTFYAGHPHYPLEMLTALWDWQRFHAHKDIPRLVRFGATGLATDFPVMGGDGQAEPNKGVFWDMQTPSGFFDFAGEPSHGIGANARIARSLFLLHDAVCEPLFRQAAINISQWLILKHNDAGYYSGDRAHATRGQADDGKTFGDPFSLDGVMSIQSFVHAYRATNNEVYIKVARKISDYLGEDWLSEHEPSSPTAIANVILSLLALDAEAPNERLRSVIRDWGAALRVRPLIADSPSANYDSLYGGIFDCAQAAFRLHALESDPDYLRYGFAALSAIPADAMASSWRIIRAYFDSMLSLVSVLPEFAADFDTLRVKGGWRNFEPDQATENYLKVMSPTGEPVDTLSLVSRSNDQVLLIVLAPPSTERVSVLKNGKHPLLKDLFTDNVDSDAPLRRLLDEDWAKVGLFTIDP
jgi:hypothetical protein